MKNQVERTGHTNIHKQRVHTCVWMWFMSCNYLISLDEMWIPLSHQWNVYTVHDVYLNYYLWLQYHCVSVVGAGLHTTTPSARLYAVVYAKWLLARWYCTSRGHLSYYTIQNVKSNYVFRIYSATQLISRLIINQSIGEECWRCAVRSSRLKWTNTSSANCTMSATQWSDQVSVECMTI